MKKKLFASVALILALCLLTACGAKSPAPAPAEETTEGVSAATSGPVGLVPEEVTVVYGESELYTQAEMDSALEVLKASFQAFLGCELHSVTYYGDECASKENLEWINSLEGGGDYVKVIAFKTNFHSPEEAGYTTLEPNMEYTDYEWWFAQTEGSDTWNYVASGY